MLLGHLMDDVKCSAVSQLWHCEICASLKRLTTCSIFPFSSGTAWKKFYINFTHGLRMTLCFLPFPQPPLKAVQNKAGNTRKHQRDRVCSLELCHRLVVNVNVSRPQVWAITGNYTLLEGFDIKVLSRSEMFGSPNRWELYSWTWYVPQLWLLVNSIVLHIFRLFVSVWSGSQQIGVIG